jgi:hypothetical protein
MSEAMNEIVGDVYIKKGLFKKDTYRMVFFEEDLVFTHVTKDMLKEEQKEFKEFLKGKKLKERIGAMLHAREQMLKKYESMSEEDLLRLGETSFKISYKNIHKVKRKSNYADEDSVSQPASVILKLTNDKMKLNFSDDRASSKAYKRLKKAIK